MHATSSPLNARVAEPVPVIFTIIGGTTVPERAAIVKAYCREGSEVQLRREASDATDPSGIGVWLQCPSLLRFMSTTKRIGHVPLETAQALEPFADRSDTVVAHGIVKSVYVPPGGEEAVVSVEITPHRSARSRSRG